jgi:nitrate reductase cytochrome c-type subunit
MMRRLTNLLGLLGLLGVLGVLASTLSTAAAEENIATLRNAPIAGAPDAPVIPKISNKDLRRVRNYPEQPPTIPHKIEGYQTQHELQPLVGNDFIDIDTLLAGEGQGGQN